MDRLRRACQVLRLRGLGYLGYLVGGYILPRAGNWLVFESPLSSFCRRVFCRSARLISTSSRARTPQVPAAPESPERLDVVSLSAREWLPQATLDIASRRRSELLGRIDNDGRLMALCGSVPGMDEVETEAFVARYRYDLDLVLDGDTVQIRKDFRDDRHAFRREWRSLVALNGIAGTPKVHRADPDRAVLFKSFVPGQTLRQRLVKAGARILSIDTETDPELAELDAAARIERVWARGRELLSKAIAPDLLAKLDRRLEAIHRCGVTGFSLSFGNVVLHHETGEPWFIDFDAAETHRHARGVLFASCRDRDRDLYNRIYGRGVLTERSARTLVNDISTPYSPIDLGLGLASRGFWSVDSGSGRWEFLNREALTPLIDGKRILDLGSYNGLMPLSMLASGARKVVAIERSPELATSARHLQRLFEWRHLRSYDLDLRCADMRSILDGTWEHFDIVTAFCSLYYLNESDMGRIVRRAAQLAPRMVVQAKTDTRRAAADNKAIKSSVVFLRALLEENGYPRVELIAPPGYSRPLLIGDRPVRSHG